MIWGQVAQVPGHQELAKEGGLSIQEPEHCLDTQLFLDEYLQWHVGGLHCSIILQRMCMLSRWGRRKQRGLSIESIGMACQGQTQR